MKNPELAKRDIENLVIADVIEITDGAFDVSFESDDGGTHIQVAIEKHSDAPKLSSHFNRNDLELGYRVLILKVPIGYLDA
tara:strand:+ start:3613 stop:3855 length:243 start_codon:yes stop_codon:yes gene_type:complete